MKRVELEHLLRASSGTTGETAKCIRPVEIERLIATFDDEQLRRRLMDAFAVCRRPEA